MKTSPQAFFDDVMVGNPPNGLSCEDFFVDDLLDLSNGDGFVEKEAGKEEEEDDEGKASAGCVEGQEGLKQSLGFSSGDDFGFVDATELAVPSDDLADLEWLSHFVEDSFSEYSVGYPTGALPEKPKWQTPSCRAQLAPSFAEKPCFKTPIPAKARSKRTRTGGRVWSLGSLSLTESSSSSTSSTSSSPSNSSPWLIGINPVWRPSLDQPAEPVSWEKPPAKKAKKKSGTDSAAPNGGSQPPRRCSHCGVQKTPQWRTGPLGAKTLCNACGVRYKSGRLLPEYRPACSPTFSSELHSNHHRKVLEMRRKKESSQPEPGLVSSPLTSF